MIDMMAANAVIPEQKKRGATSCANITKYFTPPPPTTAKVAESLPNAASADAIPEYFKRSCGPLDLSQPGHVYPRPPMHDTAGSSGGHPMDLPTPKWPHMREEHGCGESMVGVSMERIERQIFQELDSRMCQELDESKETDDEDDDEEEDDSEGQEMYENSLSMKYNREMKQRYDPHHAMYAMADAMKPEAIIGDKGGGPVIANAFNMMLSNSRATLGAGGARNDVISRVDKPSCGDCLYSEPPPHTYKWVPDLNTPMDDYKMPVNEVKDQHPPLEAFIARAEQPTQITSSVSTALMSPVSSEATKSIVSTAAAGVPSASGYPSRAIPLPPQPRPAVNEQSVEVISYEDFLKSESLVNKEKQLDEPPPPPPPPPPPVEAVVKKQSNIRRFFTRVPRTVEVKFDHKRLVTVTAVVHPQPQSPHKLPLKKTNARKHSPRRATKKQLSDTHGNAGKQGYNTRRHKSNVVVDTEEIDLTIKEMNAEVMAEEGPKAWRPIRRRLRGSGNVVNEDKSAPDGSCQKNGIADDNSFTFRTGKNLNKSSYKFTGKQNPPKLQTRDLPPRSVRPKRFQLREGSSDEEDHERPVGRSISYTFPKRTLRPRYEAMPTTLSTAATTTTTTTTTTSTIASTTCRKSARLNPSLQETKVNTNPYALNLTDDGEASTSHQPLKSIYTTTVVQPDASNSLRLKFTRIGKKRHHHRRHHHHHHHPYQRRHKKHKSAKVQKAMQLLQRAKESSIMRDPHQEEDDDEDDEDKEGLRRSSRKSSVVVRKAMEGAARAEEMRQARITAQRQTPPRRTKQLRLRQQMKTRPESKPVRPQTRSGNPVNRGSVVSGFSSARGPVKLASIFTKRVPAPAKKTSPAKKTKPVVDAAAAKARLDFLNSSIPDSLQQKLNRSQVLVQQLEEDYSPFPHTSHVQQLTEDERTRLRDEVKAPLKLKMLPDKVDKLALPVRSLSGGKLHLGSLTSISGKVSECYKSQIYQLASFNSSLKPLPPIAIRQSLADIAVRFPKFPAIKLFRRYKNKRKRMEELEETMWADQEKDNLCTKRPAEVIDLDGDGDINCEKRQKTGDSTDAPLHNTPAENKETTTKVADKMDLKTTEGAGLPGRSSWLWTDKYQPTHSADVIGNSKPVGHLRQWLLEWRERCKWAAKYGLEGSKIGRKGNHKGSWSEDDDRDFIISGGEDDSSSDGSRLCNTMLLTGPSGVGKTAAVYALAEELGFKVLEVNASSRRMGKQVLTQLQEATQSHQIVAKGKPLKQLFQTSAVNKDRKDKISWNEALGNNSSFQDDKGPSGVSLVLFEDIDLVFDDDDGFCQAVNTFMSTTKRPIILTSSVDNVFVTSKIKGHFEELKFRVPNTSVTASYMQVLCLAENLQTDFKDVLSLVEHNRGDVRQTLLSLQYWACSGGDALAREEANSLPPGAAEGSDKQDKQEIPERKASVIVENLCEDSMGNDLFETLRNADLPQDEINSTEAMLLDETSTVDTSLQRLPYAHTGCLESIRALRVFPHRSLCHALQASDLKTLASLVEQCHQLDIVLTLSNLPHLLLLPTNPSSASMTHKGPSLNIVWHVEEEPPTAETRRGDNSTKDGVPAIPKAKPAKTPFEREAMPKALSALSRLNDNLSVLDSTFSRVLGESNEESSSCWKWWYREPQDGLFDDPSAAEEVVSLPHLQEMGAYVEAATLRTCSRSLQEVMRRADFDSHKDCFTLPIVHQFLCRDNGMEPSACRQRKLDNETVCDHLTSLMQVNRHKLTSDYLPFVRSICAAEKLRQATNTKRGGRFLHYLDTMALPSSVLGRLSEEFQ